MPFYQRGDVRIRYEETGSGFPLLVTPGGGLNSRVSNWPSAVFNAMEAFKNDFRCITMDQRNANGGESTGVSSTKSKKRCVKVRVEVSDDGGRRYRQILVQEYNFSPRGATYQRQEQRLDLPRVTHLRLTIVPNKRGSGTASLTAIGLFA